MTERGDIPKWANVSAHSKSNALLIPRHVYVFKRDYCYSVTSKEWWQFFWLIESDRHVCVMIQERMCLVFLIRAVGRHCHLMATHWHSIWLNRLVFTFSKGKCIVISSGILFSFSVNIFHLLDLECCLVTVTDTDCTQSHEPWVLSAPCPRAFTHRKQEVPRCFCCVNENCQR